MENANVSSGNVNKGATGSHIPCCSCKGQYFGFLLH